MSTFHSLARRRNLRLQNSQPLKLINECSSSFTRGPRLVFSKAPRNRKNWSKSPLPLTSPRIAVLDRNGVYGSVRQHLAAKKLEHPGPYRSRDHLHGWRLLSAAVRNTERLPKSLPSHHPSQDARRQRAKAPQPPKRSPSIPKGSSAWPEPKAGPTSKRHSSSSARDHVYAELQRHMRREQEARNQHIIELAGRMKVPLLATNGAWHARPEQRIIADVLTCVREKVAIVDAGRLLTRNAERHLKTHQEMMRLFADVPHAVANTVELSNRLAFTMGDLGYKFPDYPTSGGQSMMSLLRELTQKGARERYPAVITRARSRSNANST